MNLMLIFIAFCPFLLFSEIFIDVIHRLEILTSTRRINVGDVEALQLAAYDSMDNVFSSLDGLPFTWKNTDSSILKDISVAESGLVVPASVWELDRSGVESNYRPVRGSVPGRINMTASLADPSHPVEASAEFLVIEPLFLKPASARLCPGSELKVQLLTRFKEERTVHTDRLDEAIETATTTGPAIHRREIAMPSAQYKWSSLAPDTARIDKDTGLLVALQIGSTRVRVTDVNLPEHRRESDILVVEPVSISLELRAVGSVGDRRVTCGGGYFVSQGQHLELIIYLLDAHGYRIAVTPNMQFGFSAQGVSLVRAKSPDTTPRSPLPTETGSSAPPSAAPTPSSSTIHLLATDTGVTTISVTLASVKSPAGGVEYVLMRDGRPHPLSQTVRVTVTSPIAISGPSPLRLPFISPSLPKYALHATGGSGEFTWRSSSDKLVRLSSDAPLNSTLRVDVTPLAPGLATIRATDACNPEAATSLVVEVVHPGRPDFMTLPSTKREAVVDPTSSHNILDVYVRLAGRTLDHCQHLYLHATFATGSGVFNRLHGTNPEHTTIFRCINVCPVDESTNCFHIRLQGVKAGIAQLRVNLIDSPSSQGVPLAVSPATQLFTAFDPLFVEASPLILGVGSTQEFRHVGGPIGWATGGFAEGEGGAVHASDARTLDARQTYDTLGETRFAQTWIRHATSGVVDQAELSAAAWLKHDVTSEGFLEIWPVEGSRSVFQLRCLRPSDPLALHVVVSNSLDLGTHANPLRNPLAAHGVVRVHCFPKLELAEEPNSIGIAETTVIKLKDPNYPLLPFIRYSTPTASTEKSVLAIDSLSGAVTGLRLGGGFVRASVDRSVLLVELGYPADTRQPVYALPDGLVATRDLTVEFDSFQIQLATPNGSTILRGHSTLASVVGSGVTGPSPLDESFEHVQCAWSVDHVGTPGIGLAPPLGTSFHTATDEIAPTVYGCALRLWGLRIGTHTLRVRIVVSQPPRGQAQAEFVHTSVVTVVEPLLLLSPPTIVLPPGSSTTIVTNIGPTAANHTGVQVRYTVTQTSSCRSDEGRAPDWVTVDAQGVVSVRQPSTNEAHHTADAIVLVQSVHAVGAFDSERPEFISPFTQSIAVLVSVRQVAQLFVSAPPVQLLCPSRNYTLTLGVHDSLGRRFDLPRVDEYLATVVAELSATSAAELPVHVVRAQSVQQQDQLLAAYTLHVGEPSDVHVESDGQTLHALQDFTLSFSRAGLPSLFMQFYVGSQSMCSEPAPVLLSLKLAIPASTWSSEYPSSSVHRDAFVAQLSAELAQAVDLPRDQAARIRVVNVDPSTGGVDVLILPKSVASSLHKDQWFMSYFTPVHLLNGHHTIQPTADWLSAPFALAQNLQKQAADRSKRGALWSATITRQIDAHSPFASVELTAHDADRLARERRGPSSSLSASISTSTTGASIVGQSVWSDERDYATWTRVLDSRSTDGLVGVTAGTTLDAALAPGVDQVPTHAATDAQTVTGTMDDSSNRERERERREEDEAKWKELKRRYELEKMREMAPTDYSAVGSIIVTSIATIATIGIALAYAYWYTVVAAIADRPGQSREMLLGSSLIGLQSICRLLSHSCISYVPLLFCQVNLVVCLIR